MKKEKLIEILIGMILLVLVFIMILVAIGFDKMEAVQKTTSINQKSVVSNSYNNYNNYNVHNSYVVYNPSVEFEKEDCYQKSNDYYSYGNHDRDYLFGTYANTYRVYVKNNEEGQYFRVKFYFKDKFGNEDIKTIRKYVFSEEKELFYYRDISKGKNEYYTWRYKVISD